MSPVYDCTTPEGLADALPKVVAGIREGKLVVLPTDTLYGIGSDAFSPDAVRGLLSAKGRGREMPPPVLIGDVTTVEGLAMDVPAYARALIARYWPGPLTLVLKAQPSLAWDLGETAGTVALRMPDDETALTILREVGPMAVSSANRTGHPGTRTVLDAAAQLGAAVTFYLDGGPTRGGLASTIVDCTGEAPVILREGALAESEILEAVGPPLTGVAAQPVEAPPSDLDDALELSAGIPGEAGTQIPGDPTERPTPDRAGDSAR